MGKSMNYYFTGILIILVCLLTLIKPAYPDTTQTNTSGLTHQLKVDMNQLLQLHMNQVLNLHQQQTILQTQI